MSRTKKDVGGYRGRRTVTDILTFFAVVLGVIVVLVLAGLFFAQRYIVYTDEGPKLELPPFLQMFRREEKEPTGSASLPDPGNVSVIVDPAGSQSEPGPDQKSGYALELPVEDVLNGTAAARLEEAGATSLILEMKAPSGQLAWHSDLFTADWAEVNAPASNNEALKQWNTGEVYTVARVCCFRDDSVPYSMNKLALRKGNYNWRDELGLRWLSPAQQEARDYIAGLCAELAYLGFDEIVLEQWHFPIGGNVDSITKGDRYDSGLFTAQLKELLTQVQQATAPYGTNVSLRAERDTLAGAETVSGVSPQLLEEYAYAVWTTEDGLLPATADLMAQVGITRDVMYVSPVRDENSSFSQAVIPEQ